MASRNESKTNILWRDSDSSSIKEDEDILDLVDSSKALMMKKSKSSAPGLQKSGAKKQEIPSPYEEENSKNVYDDNDLNQHELTKLI